VQQSRTASQAEPSKQASITHMTKHGRMQIHTVVQQCLGLGWYLQNTHEEVLHSHVYYGCTSSVICMHTGARHFRNDPGCMMHLLCHANSTTCT